MKYFFHILSICIIIILSATSLYCSTVDSLLSLEKNAPNNKKSYYNRKIANYYSEIDFPKANYYYNKAIAYGKQYGPENELMNACFAYSFVCTNSEGNFDTAFAWLNYAINRSKKLKDTANLFSGYSKLCGTYQAQGRIQQAINTSNIVLKKYKLQEFADYLKKVDFNKIKVSDEKRPYYFSAAECFNDFAILQISLNNFNSANEMFINFYNLAQLLNTYLYKYNACYNLIGLNLLREDYSACWKYLEELKQLSKSQHDSTAMFDIQHMKGEIYLASKKYKEALEVLNEVNISGVTRISTINYYYTSKAECLNALGQCRVALKTLDSAQIHKNDNFIQKFEFYNEKMKILSDLGDYEAALLCSDTLQDICNTVYGNGSMSELLKQIAISQYQSKINGIQLMNKRNALINKKLAADKKIRNLFFGILTIIFIIISLLLIFIRTNKKYSKIFIKNNKDLENANNNLAVSNLTKDKFFSIIAHDLKNPVGNTKNAIEFLCESYNDLSDEEKQEYISMLKEASESAYSLLEDLLIWSQTQRGEIDYHPEMIKPEILAGRVISLQRLSAVNKKIELKNIVDSDLEVYADGKLVMTILRNLVSNAIKFTQEGGTIEIGSASSDAAEDGMAVIYVKDNGVGMPAEKLNLLFRVDTNVSTPGTLGEKGTGLGLILCKEFAEKNGGNISVTSNPGEGSRFEFHLPLVRQMVE